MRIAIDAMGGDRAPEEVIKGVARAARRFTDDEFLVVGDDPILRKLLKREAKRASNIAVRHAPEVIGMHESPVESLKRKPTSSIAVCVEAVAKGKADALVSAGNTGATVAASCLGLKRLKGVQRPGITVSLPHMKEGFVALIDAGANISPKPMHLYQYAIMATVFAENVFGIANPRVGLLNIGEEDAKGTELVRKTYRMLSRSSLNFIGNVEGRDVASGECDIAVCDGFVGNIILKLTEGLTIGLLQAIAEECMKSPWSQLGMELSKGAFRSVRGRLDFSEYGGAPLLGVDGVVIVCHGRSDSRAISNAIREALRFISSGVNEKIESALAQQKEAEPEPAAQPVE